MRSTPSSSELKHPTGRLRIESRESRRSYDQDKKNRLLDRYALACIRNAVHRSLAAMQSESGRSPGAARSIRNYPFGLSRLFPDAPIWKIFGVVALLAPKFPLLKEWAYAGFFFAMSGAIFSH